MSPIFSPEPILHCLLAALLSTGVVVQAQEPAESAVASFAGRDGVYYASPADALAVERLQQPADIRLDETPLDEALRQIGERHGLNFVVDEASLQDAGVPADTPLTRQLSGVPLRMALKLLLNDMELTYRIDGGVVTVLSKDSPEILSTRVYDVADLARDESDLDNLLDALQKTASPYPDFTLERLGTLLVASVPAEEYHERLLVLLQGLRKAVAQQKQPGPERYQPVRILPGSDDGGRIEAALNRQLDVDFQDATLDEAMQEISRQIGVPVQLNIAMLNMGGLTPRTEIPGRLRWQAAPARQVLPALLAQLELAYQRDDGALLITTREGLDMGRVVVYPVGDLLAAALNDEEDEDDAYERLFSLLVVALGPRDGPEFHLGMISEFRSAQCLMIRHPEEAHDVYEALFATLRAALSAREAADHAEPVKRAAAAPKLERRIYRIPRQSPAPSRPAARVAVSDLSDKPAEPRAWIVPPAELVELIQEEVSPSSWQCQGGQARIRAAGELLIVWQTPGGHRRIKQLIADLESASR